MNIPARFIQNMKVTLGKKQFSPEEALMIFVCVQECASMSPMEMIMLLENSEVAIEDAVAEMGEAEFDSLKKELFEE